MSAHNLDTQIKELLGLQHLLTAAQLVELLAGRGCPFNKTSVYRALDRLLAARELCEHYFTAKQGLVYELRDSHHDHVACERCGMVWSVACRAVELTKTGETSPLPTGFKASHHHLTHFGLCQECQQKTEPLVGRGAAQ